MKKIKKLLTIGLVAVALSTAIGSAVGACIEGPNGLILKCVDENCPYNQRG